MRLRLIFGLMVCMPFWVNAQRFGNEWINSNQSYYKISIAADGIYRINHQDLLAAGFPVNSVDPRRMQLFFRGQEQAVFIQGQQDASFDPADFIVFYGQRNDGTQDRELYVPNEAQPNPYHNLYSDSTAYFLTWSLAAVNGKRMASFSENNISGIPTEVYHWEERLSVFTNEYSQGRQYPLGSLSGVIAHLSTFDYGEGWTGPRIGRGQSRDYTLEAPAQFVSGPAPQLEILLAGRNNRQHDVTVQVGSSTAALRTLSTVNFEFYDHSLVTENLQWSDLTGGNLVVRVTVNGVDGVADQVSVSYIRLRYPQQTTAQNLATKKINLAVNPAAKSYVEIANVPPSPYLLDITDENNVQRIGFNLVGGNTTAVIPNTQAARQLLIGSIQPVTIIKRVNFQNISTSANYLIISHESLRQPAGNYSDPIRAYQEYRASAEGGGFNTLLFNIDQLYNQFGYGEVTPLAIRRLADFMLSNGNPQYLLLIGKGLTVNYNYHRQNPATATLRDLVPTGGMPGSDVVLTSGLAGSDGYSSAIPTGRINAQTAQDVAAYLDKVKESESRGLTADYQESNTREALWKKHMVHLSGGVSLAELTLFGRYVDDFKDVAEGDFLGGQVSVQSKKSNSATELINIADEVNKGLSLITFFGHSATTRTDIEIGYVSNDELGYQNKGKYPAILINGCNAGNVFGDALTFGEDWIQTPNRGALHVIAHSAEGISSVLKRFSDAFYTTLSDSLYVGSSMGKIKNEASRRFMERLGTSIWEVHIAQVRQAILQGDPAVSLFGRAKPELEINDNSLFVTPLQEGPITVFSDSFAVNLVVRNFGSTSRDSLSVSVNRTLSNGTVVSYGPVMYPSVLYQDTLQFVVNSEETTVAAVDEVGNNRFEVIIDSKDTLDELNESNNRAYFEYFVPLGGTVHLSPHDYAIVSQDQVLLQLQPGDLQKTLRESDTRQYMLEIDTSYTFASPIKQQFSLSAKGLVLQQLELPVKEDSTVYYWRSKYAELREGEVDQWTQSSFTYLSSGQEGWSQISFEQLNENQALNLEKDTIRKVWEFPDTEVEVEISTSGAAYDNSVTEQIYINSTTLILPDAGFVCKENSINVLVLDRYTLNPYLPIDPGGFDVFNPNTCGRRPQMINTYTNAQVVNGALANLIDAIEEGNPLVIFNIGSLDYANWPAATLAKLEEVGINSTTISSLQIGDPLIVIGRKNAAAGSATVKLADPASEVPASEQLITLNQKITGKLSSGSIVSKRIGPASSWNNLLLNFRGVEASDVVNISLIGETDEGEQTTLLNTTDLSGQLDISGINAAQYPFLRLQMSVEDVINRSAVQLDYWLVNYQGVPEGILLSENNFSETQNKQEGESFTIPFQFYNLSDDSFMDSLQVAYSLFNQNTRRMLSDTLTIEAAKAGDTVSFQIPVSTLNEIGISDLSVNVNPRLQREQLYSNNFLNVPSFMKVNGDELNPIIDVAFDGTYILDGDIVSPSPMVSIEVRDENPYLQKQDTTGIDIFLGKQESAEASIGTNNARTANTQMKRIALDSEEVSWTPAEGEEPFKINFQPRQLEDGLYTLRVQAEDASGNTSGTQPYEVNFEIINESTITNFYPYPNPFSTSTRFVFTLTGQEIPDQIKVQIMTVSGKVVREITQDELGLIRIGNNITDYAWDGKDEFGDQLANGVYLYRVIVQSNGQALEMRETAGDRGFKNGFGKMYILR
ncbi:putative type IX secretion system sortase PorU2 [Catalinimonas niigatensis]|uniref:putative type IX secretion system sortase PorU2 n=1 Tax=Catalinimonas niigatensis TaxID=1397264 RepID=UPI00266714B9|nr:C25 family cysteine peptidase [Catalinimonas niigatensis]WPP48575.1 C25 family cysteine peptidase [Catalinimonas niigatensis]